MKMDLSPEILQQGRINQNKTKETPNAFAMEDGAAVVSPTRQMDKGDSRKAGVIGNRALQMLSDPMEQKRTQNWMQAFNMSPTAMQNGWVAPPEPIEAPGAGRADLKEKQQG